MGEAKALILSISVAYICFLGGCSVGARGHATPIGLCTVSNVPTRTLPRDIPEIYVAAPASHHPADPSSEDSSIIISMSKRVGAAENKAASSNKYDPISSLITSLAEFEGKAPPSLDSKAHLNFKPSNGMTSNLSSAIKK